jgi:hypothetical protein
MVTPVRKKTVFSSTSKNNGRPSGFRDEPREEG